jgi:hypothetical protein
MRKIILALLLTVMAASFAAADTIYLRDGRVIRGTVLGYVRRHFAIRIDSVQAGNSSGQTNAIVIGQSGDVVLIAPRNVVRMEIEGRSLVDAQYVRRSVEVPLGSNWVDSGITLNNGQRVQVSASGNIFVDGTRVGPDGLRSSDASAPLPRSAQGVLLGVVGTDPDSPIIELGLGREFVADRRGRLYLTPNWGNFRDTHGSFLVQVRTEFFNPQTISNRTESVQADDERDDIDPFSVGGSVPARPRTPGISAGGIGAGVDVGRTQLEKTVIVPGNASDPVDTGIDVRNGDQLTFTATGEVVAGQRIGSVGPDGRRDAGFGSILGTYRMPSAGVGALLGYIRLSNGQPFGPFLVGSRLDYTAPVDGRLFLVVNDDKYGDNSGSFTVRIRY